MFWKKLLVLIPLLPQLVSAIQCKQPTFKVMTSCMQQMCSIRYDCEEEGCNIAMGGPSTISGTCTAEKGCNPSQPKPKCTKMNTTPGALMGEITECRAPRATLEKGCGADLRCGVSFQCPDSPKCDLVGNKTGEFKCSNPTATATCGTSTSPTDWKVSCTPHICTFRNATMVTGSTTTACAGKQAGAPCVLQFMCSDPYCRPEAGVKGTCELAGAPQPVPIQPGGMPMPMPGGTLSCKPPGGLAAIPQIACKLTE